jgi:RNA polymerase sigma-70 factor (ECF subfamily)
MTRTEYNNELVRLQDDLYYMSYHFTKDEDEAKDLLQEINYKALTSWYMFSEKEGAKLKTWLYVLIKNEFINRYRKKKSDRKWAARFLEDHLPIEQPRVYGSLQLEYIEKAIDRMPGNKMYAIREFGRGKKYNEIAEALNIPIGTVKSMVHFARKRLKKIK